MLLASPEKREGQRRLFPHTYTKCFIPASFQGQRRPFFFFEKYYGFLGKKGEEEEELQWRGRTTRIEFPIFSLSRSPLQNFFSSPSPLSPFTSPSYFCALLPPSPALKRDEAEEEEEAPDRCTTHTFPSSPLFRCSRKFFYFWKKGLQNSARFLEEGGGMYASSMCMCTYM